MSYYHIVTAIICWSPSRDHPIPFNWLSSDFAKKLIDADRVIGTMFGGFSTILIWWQNFVKILYYLYSEKRWDDHILGYARIRPGFWNSVVPSFLTQMSWQFIKSSFDFGSSLLFVSSLSHRSSPQWGSISHFYIYYGSSFEFGSTFNFELSFDFGSSLSHRSSLSHQSGMSNKFRSIYASSYNFI